MGLAGGMLGLCFVLVYSSFCTAAPGVKTGVLEAAALQLGAQQAQAQYPPAALQGARAASRSAASCLVTAVQYTHGQQIWRADPCEFCLCLDGEMFCWWQDCPPAAPGPCPGPQAFSLCGNSSLIKRPYSSYKRGKKTQKKAAETSTKKIAKQAITKLTKPLVTTSQGVTPSLHGLPRATKAEKNVKIESTKPPKQSKFENQLYATSGEYNLNFTADFKHSELQTTSSVFENGGRTKEEQWSEVGVSSPALKIGIGDTKETTIASDFKSGCLVMGVEYQVGQNLPSTGSCLACHCAQDGPAAPRVTCAPRGCAPLDTAPLDDTGAF